MKLLLNKLIFVSIELFGLVIIMYGVINLMPFVIGGGFAILIIGFSLRHKYVRCPNCSKSVDKVVRRYTKRCYCECV